MSGKVVKISGPLVVAEGLSQASVSDVVRIGGQQLCGEIVCMADNRVSIQVYEDTSGIGPGAAVESTGTPLTVELGPGLLTSIYDGIQRPLTGMREMSGHNIARGIDVSALDRDRIWDFTATAAVGDWVAAGDIIGTVQETAVIVHRILVPAGVSGVIARIESGSYTVTDTVCVLQSDDGSEVVVTMMQKWPVRVSRAYRKKQMPTQVMLSGQRVFDTIFPLAKGGTAAVSGPFGTGKTAILHSIAKWSDADIVIYIGCGERGNEMTDILMELSRRHNPNTGEPLMERTVLIANTSDMPVAAREASMYAGITIAEYYRDMGYDVAVIADSVSRWAEALRELTGLLGEMPGDEGYPAYLMSRLAQFYERAGVVECFGSGERQGSVTLIGAVSPPGGDMFEPVSQAIMRIAKVLWNLDSSLSCSRRFPAVNLLSSYSLYADSLKPWYEENLPPSFMQNREWAISILKEEGRLKAISSLIGSDSLSPEDRLTLETAKIIREDFLQQNAFDDMGSYTAELCGQVLADIRSQAQEIAAGGEEL